MYAKAYLEPSQTSIWWSFLRKSQKDLIVDVSLGSKYASGLGFTADKVYRMSDSQSWLQKFVIAFLFLELIKNMLV